MIALICFSIALVSFCAALTLGAEEDRRIHYRAYPHHRMLDGDMPLPSWREARRLW